MAVDILKCLAAMDVILIHLTGRSLISGVMVFLILMFSLTNQSAPTREKALRLLGPWVVWSFIYGVLICLSKGGGGFKSYMLLTGTSLHLWFLPFAYIFTLVVYVAPRFSYISNLAIAIVSFVVCGYAAQEVPAHTYPLAQWLQCIPAVFAGCALRSCKGGTKEFVPGKLIVCGSLLVLTLSLIKVLFTFPSIGWQSVVAVFLSVTALLIKARSTTLTEKMAGITLGVYLVHPLVIFGVKRINLSDGLKFIFVTIVSVIIVIGIQYFVFKISKIKQFSKIDRIPIV